MKKLFPIWLALLLAGCMVVPSESPTLFDLGPLRTQPGTSLPALAPVSIADISVPTWLDRPMMFYRLDYANDQQPHSYAHSRWSMPPAQLLAQRLKSRIAQAGGVALSATDGALGVPSLHIDIDDFTQAFDTPGHSVGRVAFRASAFKGPILIAQKTFSRQASAPTPDAPGGARALAQASDEAIADLMRWLATLPLK